MKDGFKLLLIEDRQDDAEMIIHLLKKSGLKFTTELVMNKPDFIEKLDSFLPDVVLSDHSLPQFDAIEALEILMQRKKDVPFILVTGAVSEEFAAGIIRLGADDFILKDRMGRLPAAIDAALLKRNAAASLREKEEKIRFKADLLAAVGQGIIATQLDGTIIYWNQAAERMYGYSSDQAMGHNIKEITGYEPINNGQEKEIMKCLKKGITWTREFLVNKNDGSSFPVVETKSPIYNPVGELTGIVGACTDISELKKAEQMVKEMEQQMLHQKIKEQKLVSRAMIKAQEQERSHIGHELHDNINQILAGAKMYLTMASKNNALIKSLILYPIELINHSIEEIRQLSSKYVIPVKNIDLKGLAESLVNNINLNTSIQTSLNYKIKRPLDDELKLNIYRILQEQVNNITKHAACRRAAIKVEESDNYIQIDITDNGKGFNMNEKRNGIGLSNMMERIESFNGTMEISSAPGKGCRIHACIPY